MIARAATLAIAATLLTASPAAADTPKCVDRHEFNSVHDDMHKGTVHAVFDIRGVQVRKRDGIMTRRYKACGPKKYRFVLFDHKPDGWLGAGWYVVGKVA